MIPFTIGDLGSISSITQPLVYYRETMGNAGKDVRRDIRNCLRRGDLAGAIRGYLALIEQDPDDWTSINALGDLYLQQGRVDDAIGQFVRVADHFSAEGFLPRAAALYRKILKVRHDDGALLNLIDVVARQGLPAEAREYLIELERRRREAGDFEGADDCIESLERLAEAQASVPTLTVLDVEPPAEPAAVDTVSLVSETAEMSAQDAATLDSLPPHERAFEPADAGSGTVQDGALMTPERAPTRAPAVAPGRKPGAAKKKTPAGRRAKPLQAVFDQLRDAAEKEQDAALERFDLAQYHLRDGQESEAMIQLQLAAQAPSLRFKASAQLGRLYLWRGDLAAGIQWLERASEVPPVSPDEGHAVLYELADALERSGEHARALAVLLVLDAQRRGYRDTSTRIERLTKLESQGGDR